MQRYVTQVDERFANPCEWVAYWNALKLTVDAFFIRRDFLNMFKICRRIKLIPAHLCDCERIHTNTPTMHSARLRMETDFDKVQFVSMRKFASVEIR